MLKIAIVDDNAENLKLLESYAERYQKETNSVFSVTAFPLGIDFLTDYGEGFDIIFMDIKMPLMDGMEIAKKLRERDKLSCIIFVTSFAQYAIDGYSVNALDFMVKPVEYETFAQKLKKAIRYQEKYAEQYYYIRSEDGLVKVKLSDLVYVESQGHCIYFHKSDECFRCFSSLKDIERDLLRSTFSRCHASFIVNMEHISSMKGNELLLDDKTYIPVSRGKRESFLNDFTKFLGRNVL